VLAADRLRRGRCPRRRPGPAPAERFAQSLERLSDGLVLLDEKWRFVYLNAKAERILRQRPASTGAPPPAGRVAGDGGRRHPGRPQQARRLTLPPPPGLRSRQ
jgi:PAS domain-containing protein